MNGPYLLASPLASTELHMIQCIQSSSRRFQTVLLQWEQLLWGRWEVSFTYERLSLSRRVHCRASYVPLVLRASPLHPQHILSTMDTTKVSLIAQRYHCINKSRFHCINKSISKEAKHSYEAYVLMLYAIIFFPPKNPLAETVISALQTFRFYSPVVMNSLISQLGQIDSSVFSYKEVYSYLNHTIRILRSQVRLTFQVMFSFIFVVTNKAMRISHVALNEDFYQKNHLAT